MKFNTVNGQLVVCLDIRPENQSLGCTTLKPHNGNAELFKSFIGFLA